MLVIILLYFIGKQFFELASEYTKHEWKYGILSVVMCYGTMFLVQIAMGLAYMVMNPSFLESDADFSRTTELTISLLSVPFGLLAVYLWYYFLEKIWKKEKEAHTASIDDIGKDRNMFEIK